MADQRFSAQRRFVACRHRTIAAVSSMRSVVHEGHTPRPLQEKAIKKSWPQSSKRTRTKPWAKMPHCRYFSNYGLVHRRATKRTLPSGSTRVMAHPVDLNSCWQAFRTSSNTFWLSPEELLMTRSTSVDASRPSCAFWAYVRASASSRCKQAIASVVLMGLPWCRWVGSVRRWRSPAPHPARSRRWRS